MYFRQNVVKNRETKKITAFTVMRPTKSFVLRAMTMQI